MKSYRGFSLIELMIILAVVGILATIATNAYRSHVIKSNRAAAESFMFQVANREEQIMLDMRNYVAVTNKAYFPNAPTNANPGINLTLPDNVNKFYDLVVTTGAGSYTIKATPIVTQLADDTICAILTLDQAGSKTPTTSGCW